MAQDLKKLQWRMQFPRTQVQMELFPAIKSLCAVKRELWQELEKESKIADLFLVVQNDYPLTLQEEARLLSAADIFGAHRKDLLKKAGFEVVPLSTGLTTVDEIKKAAIKQEVKVYPHLKPTRQFGYADMAGEHETLKFIVYCVRRLPMQVQPRRWEILVSVSDAGVSEASERMVISVSPAMRNVMDRLHRDKDAKCDTEEKSMEQMALNTARTEVLNRSKLWRSLSDTAQLGLDSSDINAAYYRGSVNPASRGII